ncbi:MAG: Hpt domain-containing protein [Nitrososphaerota archaeon]
MSDEFLRVAKKEVSDDIAEIGNLLKNCSGDNDIFKNATEIARPIHKIKGLAPMMGQDQIGQIAALVDRLLKTIIAGKSVTGIYLTIKKSHEFMQSMMSGANVDSSPLKSEIEKNHREFLN